MSAIFSYTDPYPYPDHPILSHPDPYPDRRGRGRGAPVGVLVGAGSITTLPIPCTNGLWIPSFMIIFSDKFLWMKMEHLIIRHCFSGKMNQKMAFFLLRLKAICNLANP